VQLERSEESAERWERRFRGPMLFVAALVIPSLLLDSPSVQEPWRAVGAVLNWVIWLAFAGELGVLLTVSPSRWGYLRRNPVDPFVILLTPPFLTTLLNSVRLVRLLRLARLLRLEPLVTWMFRSGGLRYASAFAGLVVLAGAEAFSVSEKKSYFDGLYWAMTTVTTVGYGDELPTTTESKAVAMVVMLVGIGFFAALAGALADTFIQGRAEQLIETEREAPRASDDELVAKVDALAAQLEDLRAALRAREA
jgi:voltage-gated potassium channel